jgi:GT2 family glycosyltransferase
LESNYQGTYPCFEVVVVDNDSTDDSLDRVRDWAAQRRVNIKADIALKDGQDREYPLTSFRPASLTLIQTGRNLGYSGGNNRGIRYALSQGAQYIFQLNNDTVVSKDALAQLVRSIQTDERIAVVSPLILGLDGENQCPVYMRPPHNFWELLVSCNWLGLFWHGFLYPEYLRARNPYPGYQYDRLIPVENVAGACALYRQELFEQIGLFDETVFMYNEESILLQKLKRTQFVACLDPLAKILHKGGRDNAKLPAAFLYTKRVCGEMHYVRTYLRAPKSRQLLLKFLHALLYMYKMAKSADYRARFPEFMRLYILGRASSAR